MGKGSYDEIGSTRASARWFYSMVICSQVVGVIAVILVGVYFGQYRGGFGWGGEFFSFTISVISNKRTT